MPVKLTDAGGEPPPAARYPLKAFPFLSVLAPAHSWGLFFGLLNMAAELGRRSAGPRRQVSAESALKSVA